MYFNHRLFARALWLGLFGAPFCLRRWLYVLGFTGLFGVVWGVVAVGRALDHLLFPGFKHQAVTRPVFVVAPPRSGTTFTQKLLSLDEERFVHSKLYQTVFPSVTWQRFIQAAMACDRRLGGPTARLIGWAERRWFGGWDDLHRMRWNEPEEDDGFFVYTFMTEAIYLLFPFIEELWEAGFIDSLTPAEQKRLMRYYRSCLQRQLYVNGPDKCLLAKSTQFPGAIDALRNEFPDARLVVIARDPRQSTPSHVSLFYLAWQVHSPHIAKDSPTSQAYARLALEYYRRLFSRLCEIPVGQCQVIDFPSLTATPLETILRLYEKWGFNPSQTFLSRIAVFLEETARPKPRHQYTLAEFGLDEAWIVAYLDGVLDPYLAEPLTVRSDSRPELQAQ